MLCQNFKAIGEELSEIAGYVQTNIYIFIYIDYYYELCSFSNFSVTSPTSQLILLPFHRVIYATAHSPILPLLHLRHSSFFNPSFASPMSQALHLRLLDLKTWNFEFADIGLTWDNLFSSATGGDYSVGLIWVMLIVDIFIYNILAWYITNIVPGKYGVAQPWYFIFMVCIYYVVMDGDVNEEPVT